MRFRDICLLIGVPVVILCVWVLVFCIPLASRIEDKKRELADAENQIARIEAELSRMKESRTEGNDKAALTRLPTQIPHLEAFPDFVRRIALSVRNSGVIIDRLDGRFDDGAMSTNSLLAYPVTRLDFTGRFLDIGRMLEQIQGVKAYRRIVRAQMTAREDVYPDLKGSVEIEFKAWRD
jgi:hypothetical protein